MAKVSKPNLCQLGLCLLIYVTSESIGKLFPTRLKTFRENQIIAAFTLPFLALELSVTVCVCLVWGFGLFALPINMKKIVFTKRFSFRAKNGTCIDSKVYLIE